MDIRQSEKYANYITSIGWSTIKIGKWNAFIKQFPIIGSFIKIQRISSSIPWGQIEHIHKKYHAYKTIIEPDINTDILYQNPRVRNLNSPYSPTKTTHINVTQSEKQLFASFSSSTRRAIRRAEKNKVIIKHSNNIDEFIRLKSKNSLDKLLIQNNIRRLWHAFGPKHAVLLVAKQNVILSNAKNLFYRSFGINPQDDTTRPLASVFLLFYKKTAYYWLATSTAKGNSVAAPSLLVWEALKLSKQRNCSVFDFEGIYDERYPKAFESWKGFTKFKKGFGGKEVVYPKPLLIT